MRALIFFALFFTQAAFATETFLFSHQDAEYESTVRMIRVDISARKKVTFFMGSSDHPSMMKLGTDGIYRGFSTYGNDSVELKLYSDLEKIEYRKKSKYSDEFSEWTTGLRTTRLDKKCIEFDRKELCVGTSVITPRIEERIALINEIGSFFINTLGAVSVNPANTLYTFYNLNIDYLKNFILLDLKKPTVRCATGGVCLGDKRLVSRVDQVLALYFEETIVAFTEYGMVTDHAGYLSINEYAMTDYNNKKFEKIIDVSCEDLTPNQKRAYFKEAAHEGAKKAREAGLIDMATYKGYPTPWGGREDYTNSDDGKKCIFHGALFGWAKSPLQTDL